MEKPPSSESKDPTSAELAKIKTELATTKTGVTVASTEEVAQAPTPVPETVELEEVKEKKSTAPEKLDVAIVDISDSIENQARDVAESRMARDKSELRGVTGWFKKVFKHNLGREVYRQIQINKARKEILDKDNLYAGEEGTQADYEEAKGAIVGRFMEDYKEAVHEEAGEKKGTLEASSPEEAKSKADIEGLIKDFATGKIAEEDFLARKDGILLDIRKSKEEYFDSGKKYADNLLDVARHVKANIEHYEGVGKLDLNLDVIVGRARTGARTEAQFNAVDKFVERMSKATRGWGTAAVNEATLGIVGGVVMSVLGKGANAFARSKLVQWATLGATSLLSGGAAAYKEGYRLSDERKQHAREMAKGKTFEKGAERREEMEQYRYLTRSAQDMLSALNSSLAKAREEIGITEDGVDESVDETVVELGVMDDSEDVAKLAAEEAAPAAAPNSELAEMNAERDRLAAKVRDMESELDADKMRGSEDGRVIPKNEDLEIQRKKLAAITRDIDMYEKDYGKDAVPPATKDAKDPVKPATDPKPKPKLAPKVAPKAKEVKHGEIEHDKLVMENIKLSLMNLTDLEARIKLSDRNKIDLISYSDPKQVEKERWELDKARATAKVELRKLAGEGKLAIPEGHTFDSYLNSLVEIQTNSLTNDEDGISNKDQTFGKMRSRKMRNAFVKGALIGGTTAFVVQEVAAFYNPSQDGLVETAVGKGGDGKTNTALMALKSWIAGDAPFTDTHPVSLGEGLTVNVPEGMDLSLNPDGSYNLVQGTEIVHENLSFNPDGSMTDATKDMLGGEGMIVDEKINSIAESEETTVTAREYADAHTEDMQKIHRELWADNDTPKPIFDRNELKLWPGGENNSGIDAEGNFVYDVKHMTADGSFHKDFSTDAKALMGEGKLKMLISLSDDTQTRVFEVPIDSNGNAVIDPNSDVGRLAFRNIDGKMEFIGSTAEVAQSFGEENGIENVAILATDTGEGLDSITDTIDTVKDDVTTVINKPKDYDVPIAMPVFMRRTPLERTKKADEDNNKLVDKKSLNKGEFPFNSAENYAVMRSRKNKTWKEQAQEMADDEAAKGATKETSKADKETVAEEGSSVAEAAAAAAAPETEEKDVSDFEKMSFRQKEEKLKQDGIAYESLMQELIDADIDDKERDELEEKLNVKIEQNKTQLEILRIEAEAERLTAIYEAEKENPDSGVSLRKKLDAFYKLSKPKSSLAAIVKNLDSLNLYKGIGLLGDVAAGYRSGTTDKIKKAVSALSKFNRANKTKA